jgi:hypothetical protein
VVQVNEGYVGQSAFESHPSAFSKKEVTWVDSG